MTVLADKEYIILLQCHIVKERCPGYYCEKAFHERDGGFAPYSPEKNYRLLVMTCGGCCGLATHRKLTNLARQARKRENIEKEQIVVQLSSCMTRDNFHGPPCPHLDYIKDLIARAGIDVAEDTAISKTTEKRRAAGVYKTGK